MTRFELLVNLSDATRDLDEPHEVVMVAMRLLRERLGADRCAWADVEPDENHFTFAGAACAPGVPGVEGRFPVTAFGTDVLAELRGGRTFVSTDVVADGADPATQSTTRIRAVIAVPIHKKGRLVGGVGVHMLTPRQWTSDEIALVNDVVARCWDAIERARVEKELRASEARYRSVVDAQTEMLCRFRRDGLILFVNRAYAAARGTTPDELEGRDFWKFIPAEEQPAILEMMDRLTPESPEVRIQNRFETTEGPRWTFWSNRALTFDERGRWIEAQSTGIDITDRVRIEEALKEANQRKDEFLAMLAHELRNPLAPIRNAAEVLHRVGLPDPRQQRAREVITRQTQHLTRLVDDLLDVARITRGQVSLDRQVVDLGTVLARAVETARPFFDAKQQELSISVPRAQFHVVGDATRLVQVFENLLHNAAKYTDEGGSIRLEASSERGEVVVRVRDTGRGIAAELLPHVFDMFVQAKRPLDRAQGGLGLGLTLVKRLVTMHEGTVEAASEGPGHGTEMIVRLPLVPAPDAERPNEARPAAAASETGGRPRRVLVVEDNQDGAEVIRWMLELAGHEVAIAADGLAGVEAAKSFRPDIVICDIGLPIMDGYEVAAALRKDPTLAGTHLIALSGYGRSEDRRRAESAGFEHHLTKPVEPNALLALLAKLDQ